MRKALLAAIKKDDNFYYEEMIEECKNLCMANDIEVVDYIYQSSKSMDPNYAFRKGKLDELKGMVDDNNYDLIVFYNNLSIHILSNLTELLDIEILDRTSLILDIFSKRAKSKEAMIQTELAKLKYSLPSLLKDTTSNNKERGGSFKNKGEGETKSNLIKRNVEKRISDLNNQLKDLEKRKEIEDISRNRSLIKKVALVGYTNAGKSSLMNAILQLNNKQDKVVYEKDQLFATLDTSVRNIKHLNYEFLLFDTVGFVSDLPHELIKAFKSTLKAAKDADLLIHVMDSNNKDLPLIKAITLSTLKEIGADNIDIIEVYNKIDLSNKRDQNLLEISCKTKEGLDKLLDKIVEKLYPKQEQITILIPYHKLFLINQYQNILQFNKLSDEDMGSIYHISGEKSLIHELSTKVKNS